MIEMHGTSPSITRLLREEGGLQNYGSGQTCAPSIARIVAINDVSLQIQWREYPPTIYRARH